MLFGQVIIYFQGGNSKVYRFENPCFVLQIDVCCRAVLQDSIEPMITNRLEMNHTFRPSHSLYGTSRLDRASRPRQIAPPPPPAPTCVGVGVGVGGGAPVPARADGCPVGAPRAVMDIKHPGNPKSVCRCIPIAILRQRGSLGFKFCRNKPGIYQVYTWYMF